jgi:hypothetical protein
MERIGTLFKRFFTGKHPIVVVTSTIVINSKFQGNFFLIIWIYIFILLYVYNIFMINV